MKSIFKLGMVTALVGSIMVGCGEQAKDVKNIGVLQYVSVEALNKANEGFVAGLKASGFEEGKNIKINYDNPEGDTATNSALAKTMVRDNDLVLGIATPSATALQAAAQQQNSDVKILFTAVTDAESASLVASNSKPGGNITGTSDMNPVELQIDMLLDVIPNLDKIGILYTISESNSKVQADLATAEASKKGVEALVQTVSNVSDITMSARKLISDGADVIYIPTDNLLADNIVVVANVAYESNIPVAGGEPGQVKEDGTGATFSIGIDYYNLGYLTGQMAAEILNGKDTATYPVGYLADDSYTLVVNDAACNKIGLNFPQSVKDKYK